MNLGDMRAHVRNVVGDKAKPPFASDQELNLYLNAGLFEAVDRGLMILDREKYTVDVEAGVSEYPLSDRIIRVQSAAVISKDGVALERPELMVKAFASEGANNTPTGWNSYPIGWRIEEDGLFVLSANPATKAEIQLVVWRYARPLEGDGDEPEIAQFYHLPMTQWAVRMYYLKQDADVFDAKASARADEEFARVFGQPKSAQDHRRRRREASRSIKVQY